MMDICHRDDKNICDIHTQYNSVCYFIYFRSYRAHTLVEFHESF